MGCSQWENLPPKQDSVQSQIKRDLQGVAESLTESCKNLWLGSGLSVFVSKEG